MKFRDVVRELSLPYKDVAAACGCSLSTVRAAMLPEDSKTHRNPPRKWRQGLILLLRKNVDKYHRAIVVLESDMP